MKKRQALFYGAFIALFIWRHDLRSEILYPWKEVYIGALDGKAWTGLVLIPNKESGFAFRFKVEKEGQSADELDLSYLISEVGPHSPDGHYSRIKLDLSLPFKEGNKTPILIKPPSRKDTLTLEWARKDEKTVIGRVIGPKYITLHLVNYLPWDFRGRFRLTADNEIQGESQGGKPQHFLLWTNRGGILTTGTEGESVALAYPLAEDRALYFVAGVGEDPGVLKNHTYRFKNRKTIDTLLEEIGRAHV